VRRLTRKRLRFMSDIAGRGPTEAAYAWLRARRRRRNIADDELQLLESDRLALAGDFDLTPGELEANAAVLRAYAAMDALEVRSIHWFVPSFHLVHAGGIHTVLRFADHAARRHGARSRFTVFDSDDPAMVRRVESRIGAAFPALAGAPVLPASAEPPGCDAAFATAWESIYRLARFRGARAKLVFVQDWEAGFHAAGSMSALLAEAAALGFPGVANTPALADAWRAAGNPAVSFLPAVDTERFHPATGARPDGPVRVFFYGRPSSPRNAFALGLLALRRLKREYGDRVEIVCAGEDWSPGQYGVADVLDNLGALEDLDSVAELYRSCHVGLVFMLTRHPSYQPLEFMASGTVTVSNSNPYTGWLLRHEHNALLAPPIPALVARELGRLVDDPALRRRIAAEALEGVRRVRWEDQLERAWGALTKGGVAFTTEPELGGAATGAPRSAAPRG
jgi:glycosyltransferase involved in cell wall biosynthesis